MASLLASFRSEGDPKIIESGPGSLTAVHTTAKALGWFSIGLGLAELFAGRRLANALGLENRVGLIRAFGAREMLAGVMTLSTEKAAGLWSRAGGDVLDLVTLATAFDAPRHRQRTNAKAAFLAVAAITAVDVLAARAMTAQQRRTGTPKDYSSRSGFPRGAVAARNSAVTYREMKPRASAGLA